MEKIKVTKILKEGDTIKRADKDEAVESMLELARRGVETDFIYYDDEPGKVGLVVTDVVDLDEEERKYLMELAESLKEYCDGRKHCKNCTFGYGKFYCLLSGDNPSEWMTKGLFEC